MLKNYQRMTVLTSTVSMLTMPGRKSFRAEVTLGAEVEKSSLKQKCHSGFECFMRTFMVTEIKHCWHAISRSGWKKKFMRVPRICCLNVANFWLSLSVMWQDVKNNLERDIFIVRLRIILLRLNALLLANTYMYTKYIHVPIKCS